MLQAAQALSWKNNGLLATFGLRLNNGDETDKSRTTLESFFVHAQLCAAAPWGWGLVQPIGIAQATSRQDRPLHLVRAHPFAYYFDFAYCPPGAPWSLLLRAVPWGAVRSSMMEHDIAAVMSDMRRALSVFNGSWKALVPFQNGPNEAHPARNGHVKRHERGRQSKPNRARQH